MALSRMFVVLRLKLINNIMLNGQGDSLVYLYLYRVYLFHMQTRWSTEDRRKFSRRRNKKNNNTNTCVRGEKTSIALSVDSCGTNNIYGGLCHQETLEQNSRVLLQIHISSTAWSRETWDLQSKLQSTLKKIRYDKKN